MEPTYRPFDDPAMNSQTASMFGVTPSQDGLDATLPQRLPMGLGVIGSISLQSARSPARTPALTPYGWDRFNQGKNLRHVVTVGACDRGCQWNAASIGYEVMLAARFSAICGAG